MGSTLIEPESVAERRARNPCDQDIPRAVQSWTNLLGTENVRFDAATIERYSRTTLPKGTTPLGVIRPSSTEEVRQAVLIASSCRVPIHPISRGKNWGYGDACAPTDGQVIMDLGRMNRILEVNTELAYATIEPGVTQGQMYEHLRDKQIPLMLDVTGAGPEASIVGNTLQRGFGHTPYGDHFRHTSGMEVVLADGRVLKTGFGAYENAKAAAVFPWGVGPWLDGLFTQSNLGIVTKMTIWLMPKPPYCRAFAMAVQDDAQLKDLIDAVRTLRLTGVVRSAVHVGNDLRLISARRQYPWELTAGATPLPDDVRLQLRRELGVGAWNLIGALYGTRETVSSAARVVKTCLRQIGRVRFFDERKIRWAGRLARLLNIFGSTRLRETLQSVTPVFNMLQGIPSPGALPGALWRTRSNPDAKLFKSNAFGLIWLSPIVPLCGPSCYQLMTEVSPILRDFGFEPLITFTAVTDRAAAAVISICYDGKNPKESRAATDCYDALLDLLHGSGHIPYRVSPPSMRRLYASAEVFWDVSNSIKQTLDPRNVIAPT